MPRDEVEAFYDRLANVARDPLTNQAPRCEIELTAAFVVRQAQKKIDWSLVHPRFVRASPTDFSFAEVLSGGGLVFSEYPLFAASGQQSNRWGQMRADAVIVSGDWRHTVMIEAKVDSYFTYGDRPPDAQLSRQLDYLAALNGDSKTLLLLCPNFNLTWYETRLSWAWDALTNKAGVFACVATWENVFNLNGGTSNPAVA